jgi:hypothetical protein
MLTLRDWIAHTPTCRVSQTGAVLGSREGVSTALINRRAWGRPRSTSCCGSLSSNATHRTAITPIHELTAPLKTHVELR